jgi:hypothetical protein
MTHQPKLNVVAGVALILIAAVAAYAENDCAASKIKASCKKAYCKARLEAAEAAKGVPVDPYKAAVCEAKFSTSFAKLEAIGGCATSNDTAALETKVDAFVADLDSELDVESGTNPNKCEAAKIKAAAKKASCKCALEVTQAASPGNPPIPPGQTMKCETAFSERFAKAEAYATKVSCNTTGDTDAIEAKVDAFVADVDTELYPQ